MMVLSEKGTEVHSNLIASSCIHKILKWGEKRVDPTCRKMAIATELFVSRLTYIHIQNLHSQIYNLS